MALITADRVQESSTTTGTGALTLAGAYAGYRRFSAVCSTNDTTYYCIEALDSNGNPSGDWEVGLGTYSGTNTLTRTTVHFSSNSNAAVNFGAGTKRVFTSATATFLTRLSDLAKLTLAQGDLLYYDGSKLTNLGAGTSGQYLKTQGAGANPVWASVSSGGSAWNLQWGPLLNEAPSSNFATLDTRNGHPCLDFDTSTQETAIFSGVLPADYSGAGITVHIFCSLTSATSGTVGWDVAIERMDASSLDIDSDSFATAQTVTAVAVPGTSGQLLKMSVNISNGANMDSLAAGEMFRLRIRRDVANDTATGDAELLRVMMVSQ
jgi:hypothetical protein